MSKSTKHKGLYKELQEEQEVHPDDCPLDNTDPFQAELNRNSNKTKLEHNKTKIDNDGKMH